MKYQSTRSDGAPVGFATATMHGLAPDGGLYMPITIPEYSAAEWRSFARLSYGQLAHRLLMPFVEGSLSAGQLERLIGEAYRNFPACGAPLVQLDHQLWLLELYRGPTLAFKDYALQLLGRLFRELLKQQQARLVLLGATSGDTGAAALAAVARQEGIGITMLHPHERVSPIQRRQMTTLGASNIRNIAIDGSFDDCQDIVKALFADQNFRDRLPISSVNSINWARVMAQIVYYAHAALSLGVPDRPINFCVPSGNFGNVFAGYLAKRMGLPINTLAVASNANDILHRMIAHNDTNLATVVPTLSPSMDIQISSNFERLLYLLNDADSKRTAADIQAMRSGQLTSFSDQVHNTLRETFVSGRLDDDQTVAEIARVAKASRIIIDPHTAIATAVANQHRTADVPMVVLGTAHPAKFSDALTRALGKPVPLPPESAAILEREEIFTRLPNEAERVKNMMLEEFADYA